MSVLAGGPLRNAMAQMPMRIQKACKDWENAPDHLRRRGVRIEVGLPDCDPTMWLLAQRFPRQVLWSRRDGSEKVAGVGCCCELPAGTVERPEELFVEGREILDAFSDPRPRFFGGFSFASRSVREEPWPAMGTSQFWIPRVEVLCREGKAVLAWNALFQKDVEVSAQDLLNEWKGITAGFMRADPLPTLMRRQDHPDRDGWEANVRSALDLIENGVLDKVVLARKAVYTFAVPVPAVHILAVLEQVTSNCYHFLIQPSAEAAFMGTTPERLYRREGRSLETEALAGTRPRVSNEEEDARYAKELMDEPKERHEQELVRRDLIRQLHLLCDTLDAESEPRLLKLERKQHLLSRLEGSLREGVGDGDILKALHPTPAVGGSPRANALRELPALEPFSRGWYAAPVGCFGMDDAEFAVAIRSGLVRERNVNIYSGAGIVKGSDPAAEWQEIENKISDFVKVTRGQVR